MYTSISMYIISVMIFLIDLCAFVTFSMSCYMYETVKHPACTRVASFHILKTICLDQFLPPFFQLYGNEIYLVFLTSYFNHHIQMVNEGNLQTVMDIQDLPLITQLLCEKMLCYSSKINYHMANNFHSNMLKSI